MTLWPYTVELDGVSIPLAEVVADVTIHHGRTDINDEPTASTCQLTFHDVDKAFVSAFEIGQALAVTARNGAAAAVTRFSGRISDARLEVDELTVIAAGPLSRARQYPIGDVSWPEESWSARVVRAFAEAGFTRKVNLLPNGDFETNIAGWTPANSTIARSTAQAKTGVASLQMTRAATVGDSNHGYAPFTLPHTGPYTGVAWLYIPAGFDGTRVFAEMVCSGATGTLVVEADVSKRNQWQRLVLPFVTGANLNAFFSFGANNNTAGSFFFADAVEVSDDSTVLDLRPDPVFDPILAARDPVTAGPTTLGDYIAFLAPMVGALVADLPGGRILVQAIGARNVRDAYTLDSGDVAYAPAWLAALPGGNIVTVRYHADQGASVTVSEPSSIALYGERPETIDTSFRDQADATYRANNRLGRGAFSHWTIAEAPVLRGLALELGKAVILQGMPAASPYEPWNPILEGWTDTITGPDWTMTLSLSDPLVSGVTLTWGGAPPAELWNTVNLATDWTEALTVGDL